MWLAVGLTTGLCVSAACYLASGAFVAHPVAVALAGLTFVVTTAAIGWALR